MSAHAAQTLSEWLIVGMSLIPVAIVSGPATEDHYAMAGAALAACLAGLYALSKRKTFLIVASTIISSAAVGTIGPGSMVAVLAVFAPGLSTQIAAAMTWHIYAGAGLFWGLGGWALLGAVMRRWEANADGLANRPFDLFNKQPREQDKDHDHP